MIEKAAIAWRLEEKALPNTSHKKDYYVIHPDDQKPRVRWGDGYALIHLARPQAPIDLSGKRSPIGYEGLHDKPRVLVFGERSGGGKDLLAWWRKTLDDNVQPWIYVQGDRWQKELHECSEQLRNLQEQAKTKKTQGPFDFIKRLGEGSRAERAEALVGWARQLKSPLYLIIRDLGGLGDDSAQEAVQALRIAGENKVTTEHLRILVVSTSESRFEDRYDVSGYAAMCERYRLPWLVEEEIVLLASQPENACSAPDDDALDDIVVATGGQPLLVQWILELLCKQLQKNSNLKRFDVRKCYREVRGSPPGVVSIWKHDLRSRLEQKPELKEVLHNYVAGGSRGIQQGLPADHVSLMIPGWIRFDRNVGRLKISSKLHARFAQQVLDTRG